MADLQNIISQLSETLGKLFPILGPRVRAEGLVAPNHHLSYSTKHGWSRPRVSELEWVQRFAVSGRRTFSSIWSMWLTSPKATANNSHLGCSVVSRINCKKRQQLLQTLCVCAITHTVTGLHSFKKNCSLFDVVVHVTWNNGKGSQFNSNQLLFNKSICVTAHRWHWNDFKCECERLFKVNPASRPKAAGIGPSPPQDLTEAYTGGWWLDECVCLLSVYLANRMQVLFQQISACLTTAQCVLAVPAQSAGNTFRCFILDKRQLLPHITYTISCTRLQPWHAISLCPWYLMTFLSVPEDRRNSSEWTFGKVWLISLWMRT